MVSRAARLVANLVISVAATACPVIAQVSSAPKLSGLSMEDLAKVQVESVYGASKFLQNTADVPTSVTVVTAEQIRKFGFRTLADVLRSVRGFYVIYDRNYTYVGVRGFSRPGDYNARILFLVDGHRVNDNIFDGAYVGTEFPVDLDIIDRIEIVRGPNSSVYGTGAFVAVVNVITERGRDLGAAELSAEAGGWNSYKTRITYGNRFDSGLETLFSGSFFNSQGHPRLLFPEFESPATNNGVAVNADADHSYNAVADVIDRDFEAHFVDSSRTKHVPTAPFGTVFNDPRTRTTDARAYLDLQYHHTHGSWELLGRASYDWYGYHGIYVYDYSGNGVPPYTQNYDAARGDWLDFQADASRAFSDRDRLTLGTEFRQDLSQQQVNYDIQPYHLYLDSRRSAYVAALYLQNQYSLRRNLSFVVGVRSDWHQQFETSVSPHAGLLYVLRPGTDIRAAYSAAFRAPNSYEQFYAAPGNTANGSLQPERIRSAELGVEHHFGQTYVLSGETFLNRIDDGIDQQIDPSTKQPQYVNSSTLQTKGFEWELDANWKNGFRGVLSHTVQDTQNVRTREVFPDSPKQLAKADLSFPLLSTKLFASIDAQYVSERRTVAQTDLGGYFLMNVTLLARKLSQKFDFSAGLYNVLGKKYAESGDLNHREIAIPQDGRSFRIELTYRLPAKHE